MPNIIHPAMRYADDVMAGKIVVNKYHRLFVERHLRDLEQGEQRGLYFDEAAAQEKLDFFAEYIRHWKGEWAGRPFVMEPWQLFRHYVLWGWMREDTGFRRFREAYNQMARKQGKSFEAAGVGINLTFFDGEPGAEGYCAATKRDQSKIVWTDADRSIAASEDLSDLITRRRDVLFDPETHSKLQPLGSDADSTDGLNSHVVIFDEIHALKNRLMYEVLETSTGTRRQPLIYGITTPGHNIDSMCHEMYIYTKQILDGEVEDDSFYGFIAEIDDGDDWQDESCWIKANPNLHVSVKLDDLQRKAAKASKMPSKLNAFMRLHLGLWVKQVTRFIDMDIWDACAGCDPNDYQGIRQNVAELERHLEGRHSLGGLDLGRSDDLTSLQLVFMPEGDEDDFQIISRFWMPDSGIRRQVERGHSQYATWARDGWIKVTPGNAVDYGTIQDDIEKLSKQFPIDELNYDQMYAGQMVQALEGRGIECFPLSQTMRYMSAPTKEFERLLLENRLHHGGNPVLRSHADAVSVKEDSGGNIRPVKPERATGQKIDGIVALIMALDRALRHQDEGPSVYKERGIWSVDM